MASNSIPTLLLNRERFEGQVLGVPLNRKISNFNTLIPPSYYWKAAGAGDALIILRLVLRLEINEPLPPVMAIAGAVNFGCVANKFSATFSCVS